MPEEILIRQGAPTLAGIKTGSLFPCPCEDREALLSDIRQLNRRLSPKGLCLLPIRFLAGQAGYEDESCARYVARLACRFRESGEFPHEVGLFLSYPPENVKGFIDHRANDFKCAGLWKVYGNEEKARSLFTKYRKCTEIYCTLWQSGSRLEQLAVAV